jgi:hypothetical protein
MDDGLTEPKPKSATKQPPEATGPSRKTPQIALVSCDNNNNNPRNESTISTDIHLHETSPDIIRASR